MIKFCGLAILTSLSLMILKELRGAFPNLIGAVTVILFSGAAMLTLSPAFNTVSEMLGELGLSSYAGTLVKALGIAYAAEITGEICRAGGADSAASGIELVGRAELTVLALPLLTELLTLALSFF